MKSRLALALVAFVAALAAVELALRVASPLDVRFFDATAFRRLASAAEDRFELIPGGRNDAYIGVPVSINALGFRDHEIAVPKPADTVRILVLGDSVTFGYGVRLEEAYPKVLERMLNERATPRRWQVINAGVEGAGLASYYLALGTWVPRLSPDLVLIGLVLNDITHYDGVEVVPREARLERDPGWLRATHGEALRRSKLYLGSYLAARSLAYQVGWLDFRFVYGHSFLPLEPPSALQDRAWQSSLAVLDRIVGRARELEVPLLLALFPMEPQTSPAAHAAYEHRFHLGLDRAAVADGPQRRLAAFAAERSAPLVDLLPVFRAAADQGLFLTNRVISRDPVHPSPAGHRLAALGLAEVLAAGRPSALVRAR